MPGWIGWTEGGGVLIGATRAGGRNADGRQEVFAEVPGVAGPTQWRAREGAPGGAWPCAVRNPHPTPAALESRPLQSRDSRACREAIWRSGTVGGLRRMALTSHTRA